MFADKITIKMKLLSGGKIKMKMDISGILTIKVEGNGKTVIDTAKIANNDQSPHLMVDVLTELLKRAKG